MIKGNEGKVIRDVKVEDVDFISGRNLITCSNLRAQRLLPTWMNKGYN
jgi:hypothetical protein